MRLMVLTAGLVLCGMAFGQIAGQKLEFREASVRPARQPAQGAQSGMLGGPGTGQPAQFIATSVLLQALLSIAYDVRADQISGPSWLATEYYDIVAKVQEGATRKQFQTMLQNLLTDRFKMTVHFAKKNFSVFAMTVEKGGPKLNASAIDPNAPPLALGPDGLPVVGPLTFSKDGFPELPPGKASILRAVNVKGHELITARQQSLAQIAKILEDGLGPGKRVVDETGLTGEYDFHLVFFQRNLEVTPAQILPPGVEFFDTVRQPVSGVVTAAQQQLGLTLAKGKAALSVLVVDHINKAPAEN